MLSVAMIIAAVPQAAFAAETVSDDETPVVTEEEATEAPSEEASESQPEQKQEPVEGDSGEEIVQQDAGNEVAEDNTADEAKLADSQSRVLLVTGKTTAAAGNFYELSDENTYPKTLRQKPRITAPAKKVFG